MGPTYVSFSWFGTPGKEGQRFCRLCGFYWPGIRVWKQTNQPFISSTYLTKLCNTLSQNKVGVLIFYFCVCCCCLDGALVVVYLYKRTCLICSVTSGFRNFKIQTASSSYWFPCIATCDKVLKKRHYTTNVQIWSRRKRSRYPNHTYVTLVS